jgi:predicted DNA-binding transcriptional regulator YafY
MSTRLPDAIREHRVVEFAYDGRTRTVEPHAIGYDNAGALVLHGWELSGGRGQAFRSFGVRDIRMLIITAHRFPGARAGYAPESLPMQKIVYRLDRPAMGEHAA